MSNPRKATFAVVALAMIYAAFELHSGWRYAHQPVEWKIARLDTYDTEYPSHWQTTEHDRYPSLDRTHMSFKSTAQYVDDDSFERRLGIQDEGIPNKDLETLAGDMRQQGENLGPVRDIRLENNIIAKTWTDVMSMVEVGVPYRIYLFKAPNGHIYTAIHDIPQGWKHAWRYDRLFRRILGSMKFKDAPPAAKKP